MGTSSRSELGDDDEVPLTLSSNVDCIQRRTSLLGGAVAGLPLPFPPMRVSVRDLVQPYPPASTTNSMRAT